MQASSSEHLRLLSIFHYVVGGLHALFGCFGLIHFTVGLAAVFSPLAADFPSAFGWIFVIVGGGFVLFGLTLGAVTAVSGRFIAQRRKHTFSIVVAAVNCAMLPFGTVLGVFTIVILNREDVIQEYQELPR